MQSPQRDQFDPYQLDDEPYGWASCFDDLSDDVRGILQRPPRVAVCPEERFTRRVYGKTSGRLANHQPPCAKYFCGCQTDNLVTYRDQLADWLGFRGRVYVTRYKVTLAKNDADARRTRKRIADRASSSCCGSYMRFTMSDGWEYVLATVDVSRPRGAPHGGMWIPGDVAVTLMSHLVGTSIRGKPRGSWTLDDADRPVGDSNNAGLGTVPRNEDVRDELARRLTERFGYDPVNDRSFPPEDAERVKLAWAEEYADLTTIGW